MADDKDRPGNSSGPAGTGGGGSRNRRRSRNRNRPSGGGQGAQSGQSGAQSGQSGAQSGSGSGAKSNGRSSGGSRAGARQQGGRQGSGSAGGGNRSGGRRGGGAGRGSGGGHRGGGGGGGDRGRTRERGGQRSSAVTVAPAAAVLPVHEVQERPGLGATQIFPAEVAANRRRVAVLCAWTAVIPAVLVGALLAVTLSFVAGVIALVVVGVVCGYAVWRVAPRVSMRRIGAVPADEHDYPRFYNITEGLCATFGLRMPVLHVVHDPVPNACALGRDARASDLVVTTGLLDAVGPIELEGVIAHELAHVKRGDNGVSSIGITLASLFGGEATLRRCIGARACREYRADVVGASTVRYPRGLLDALRLMTEAPPPQAGSVFAHPRFGGTRWVWIDPSVGHRQDDLVPGDLDATSVRTAALSEW